MKRILACSWCTTLFSLGVQAAVTAPTTTVLTFDDLGSSTYVTGTSYGGLIWEQGNAGFVGRVGGWKTVPDGSSNNFVHSPGRNLINYWGSTLVGISFNSPVNVAGAYFAGQGDGVWTSGVRVHGYLSGILIMTTDWFYDIDSQPDWFQMDLLNVDRIVIESVPTFYGAGYFGMDDFTYQTIPEPGTLTLAAAAPFLLLRRRRQKALSTYI